jgi:hypothetical protein
VTGDLVGTDTVTAQGHRPWTGHARSGDFYLATSGDRDLATSGDFFMATDSVPGVRLRLVRPRPRLLLVAAAAAVGATVYARYVRPWQLTWGATSEEVPFPAG